MIDLVSVSFGKVAKELSTISGLLLHLSHTAIAWPPNPTILTCVAQIIVNAQYRFIDHSLFEKINSLGKTLFWALAPVQINLWQQQAILDIAPT